MHYCIESLIGRACIVALVGLTSCTDMSGPPMAVSPPPDVEHVQADTSETDRILLDVVLNEPGTVRVEYWNASGERIRVQVPLSAATGSILLPRMEAGATYQYVVEGVSDDGHVGSGMTGAVTAPALPADLAALHLDAEGTPSLPLTMLEVNATFRGFVAVDGAGKIVWWWRTQGSPRGFTRRANGNLVLNDLATRLVEIAPNGEVLHELLPLPHDARSAHHDVVATPDNTLLFISLDRRPTGDSTLAGDAIWEWNPETGASAMRWSTFDFFNPSTDVGTHSGADDWVHANSLALGDHGNVILSLNWLDQIISIAPGWSSLEWKLGGRGSTYAVTGDIGFAGQHSASLLANGHIMMFDNGRDRAAPYKYSRGLELALDEVSHTARRAWEFRTTPDTYAPYVGSSRRLANGNTMICFGTPAGFAYVATGPMAVYEVRPDGHVVWKLKIDDANLVYRATPMASIANELDVP